MTDEIETALLQRDALATSREPAVKHLAGKGEIEQLWSVLPSDEREAILCVYSSHLRAALARIDILTRQLEEARATIRKAHDALGPAVSDVEIISKVAAPIYKTFGILRDALSELEGLK